MRATSATIATIATLIIAAAWLVLSAAAGIDALIERIKR